MQPGFVLAERFEIERLAETGGVGVIYRARDRETNEPVAVKVLRLEGPDHAERFAREARVLEGLDHPAIVRFVAHGTTKDGRPFVAMEWVEGPPLGKELARGPLPVADALTLARRVAEGLAYAHARGIIHRDINPNNLLLPGRLVDEAKIVDFGLVRLGEPVQTLSGTILGTPGFMSPEQVRGRSDIDARADVFALGCVLFMALTGTAPFAGEFVASLAKVLFERAPRVARLRQDVPWAVDELVDRMLSPELDERPRDGSAVLDELEALPTERRMPSGTPGGGVLTVDEQRYVSVVVALAPAGAANGPAAAGRARTVGERFSARVEILADGTIVAALSSKGNARDEARQAARCALALRDVLEDRPLALATGRVARGASGLVGEVIERATGLLRTAGLPVPAPGRRQQRPILIDATTAGLLDSQFDVDGDGVNLGLRRERSYAATEATRTLLGRQTPFVGRTREMATLEGVFRESTSDSVARAVLVSAPSGAGKTRLRRELVKRVRDLGQTEIYVARGDPMSAGSPLGMIAQFIRGAAGVHEGETLRTRQAKLNARVSRHLVGLDLKRVAEFLGEIAGIRFSEEDSVQLESARRNAVLMGDQMRRAWEDFIAAECAAQPVLLVLEDLHWGDLPTVSFLDGTLRNLHDKPLMILALAQPDVHRIFPDLWSGHPTTRLRLGELSQKASESLARQMLGEKGNDRTIARVIEQAAGNAFYLEELIRSVAEGREELPPTVLAMVETRLASLDPEARRVLRAASVFGSTFWKAGVGSLLDETGGARELGTQLADLTKREFIRPREGSRFPDEFVFRHVIVREAAYGMLVEADRVLGHRLAGVWLEQAGESDAMALAEQFERGSEPRRAVTWYLRASTQALEGNDFGAVIARVKKGIACGAAGAELGHLLLLQAQAYRWRGELAEVASSLTQALATLPRGSAAWYEAAGVALSTWARLGRHDGLEALVDAVCDESVGGQLGPAKVAALTHAVGPLHREGLHRLARKLFDWVERAAEGSTAPGVVARVHQGRANLALGSWDPTSYITNTDAAARAFELAGDLRNAALQRSHAGYAKMRLGAYAEAEQTLRDALASSERMALPVVAVLARQNLGITLAYRGALHEARAMEEQAVESAKAAGEILTMAGTSIYLAEILALAGSLDAAERSARDAIATLGQRLPEVRMYALATLARVLVSARRVDEALKVSGDAMALHEKHGAVTEAGDVTRLARAEALHAAGDVAAARDAIRIARERLLARADRIADASLRQSFVERVPMNARTLRLAAEWVDGVRY